MNETNTCNDTNEAVEIAMQIILHAGNARELIYKAGERVKVFQFDEAQHLLCEAEKELNLAHVSQTGFIQKEARGETVAYSMLFTHAQDTLMTIVSEHNMMKQMMEMMQALLNVIKENGGK